MSEKFSQIAKMPNWYLQTFRIVQHIEGSLRNAEGDLHEAIEEGGLDERVRNEMQGVVDAIHAIKGNLFLLDMTAHERLDQIMQDSA